MKNPFKKSIKKFELINAMNADSDLVAIKKIIKSNPNSVFETDIEEGYTALHYAAWDNKFDIVKLLIKSGAEIDPIGKDGLSPFLLAANNGFYEIVEILADNGADINRISQDAEDPYQGVSGSSAIRTASLNQYWDVVSFLMNRDVKLEILLEPCLGNPNGLTDFFEVMRAVGISNENILNDPDEINAFEEVVKERLNLNSEKKEVVQEDETDETIMKNEINEILMGSFFSGVAFLYISFCQITDGEVADTEMKMIFEKMREIGLQTNLNNDQVQNEVEGAIDRFITVNKRYGHPGLLLGFFNIMSKLKNHSAFNKEIAESIYLDLTNLMNADGVQNENEIDVLAYVKREFGLQDQKNTSPEKDKEQDDDNKGYPGISTRVKKDDAGNKDEELNARINKYLGNWQCATVAYNGRLGIEGRIPSWIHKIDSDDCCPKFSDKEIEFINNKIITDKIIPVLSFAPEEFYNETKQVWWIVPLSIWAGDKASWLFIDKNGMYAAHPGDEDMAMVFPWDSLEDMEYLDRNIDTSESEVHSLNLIYDKGEVTYEEFVPPGRGSYLSVINSIYQIRKETIEVSKGEGTWFEGAGGEGYKSFEKPTDLLTDKNWKNPNRPNPAVFGYTPKEESKTAEDYFNQGKEKKENKDYKGAIEVYSKIIEIDPKNEEAFQLRGVSKLKLKDFKGAVEDSTQAIEIDSEWWPYYVLRGTAKNGLNDFVGAIVDFKKSLELNPEDANTYQNIANAKSELKDFEGAIEDYSKVIALDPNYKWAYQQRGKAKSELNDHIGVIEDLSKVIEIDANNRWSYWKRAEAKREINDFKEAIIDYNKAIELDTNYDWAYYGRGLANKSLKKYEAAVSDLNKAIEINPNWWILYKVRGEVKIPLEDYKNTIDDFMKAIELHSYGSWMYIRKDLLNLIETIQKKSDFDVVAIKKETDTVELERAPLLELLKKLKTEIGKTNIDNSTADAEESILPDASANSKVETKNSVTKVGNVILFDDFDSWISQIKNGQIEDKSLKIKERKPQEISEEAEQIVRKLYEKINLEFKNEEELLTYKFSPTGGCTINFKNKKVAGLGFQSKGRVGLGILRDHKKGYAKPNIKNLFVENIREKQVSYQVPWGYAFYSVVDLPKNIDKNIDILVELVGDGINTINQGKVLSLKKDEFPKLKPIFEGTFNI